LILAQNERLVTCLTHASLIVFAKNYGGRVSNTRELTLQSGIQIPDVNKGLSLVRCKIGLRRIR